MFIVVTYVHLGLRDKVTGNQTKRPGTFYTTNEWSKAMELMDRHNVGAWQSELWFWDKVYHAWYRIRFQFNSPEPREWINA